MSETNPPTEVATETVEPKGRVVAAKSDRASGRRGHDALAAILPAEARARMAMILTESDFATLRHLAEKGTGANTLRAIASDLNYLETWAHAALGHALPWPASEALALKFVAHHLYDADEHERDATHGMPKDVRALLLQDGCLKTDGPHAPATVRRRLALWSTIHRWKGLEAPFGAPSVRHALRLAVRANPRPRGRKSAQAVTKDVLEKLLATCRTGSIVDLRDRAILLLAFASGGRRRSEIARLKVSDLVDREPVWSADGTALPSMEIRLGRTKTADADADESVYIVGRPVVLLEQWLALAGIQAGSVFRAIDRFGRLGAGALDGQSINAILKKRCAMAGLTPAAFSAHGLRSGYLTEAARQGVPLQEAMAQSRHRSVQQAADYYNGAEIERGLAARLGCGRCSSTPRGLPLNLGVRRPMVTRKSPGDPESFPERFSDEEVARIRKRRAGVRASLACSGLFLTDEEERLLDEMEEDRLTLEQRDARVMEFIRASEGRTRDHSD